MDTPQNRQKLLFFLIILKYSKKLQNIFGIDSGNFHYNSRTIFL